MIFNLFKSTLKNDETPEISITKEMKDDAKTFIETILSKAGFDAIVAVNNDSNDLIYIMIQDEYETARIIGKDGQTLTSFWLSYNHTWQKNTANTSLCLLIATTILQSKSKKLNQKQKN